MTEEVLLQFVKGQALKDLITIEKDILENGPKAAEKYKEVFAYKYFGIENIAKVLLEDDRLPLEARIESFNRRGLLKQYNKTREKYTKEAAISRFNATR